MLGWMRHFRWAGAIALAIAMLGAYPTLMVLSHDLPDDLPDNIPRTVWADARVGAAIELIEAELADRGWMGTHPSWHPRAQLTAMPSFQEGMAETLTEFIRLRSRLAGTNDETDTDLRLAATLISQATSADAPDQLAAAMQALRRFDGLIARAVFDDRDLVDLMHAEAVLYSALLTSRLENLQRTVQSGAHGVLDLSRTARYYKTLGTVYTIGALLKAGGRDDIVQPGYRVALAQARDSLARAFRPHPLLVSNPEPGSFSFGGNDLVTLAFLLEDAIESLGELEVVLEENQLANMGDLDSRS